MKKTLTDLLLVTQKRKEKYFKDWQRYGLEIKKYAQEILKDAKVYIFGSIIDGTYNPSSDIDVLIVSKSLPKDEEKRREIKIKIKSKIDPFSPFQLHLATPEEFENWYLRFIKNNFVEIR